MAEEEKKEEAKEEGEAAAEGAEGAEGGAEGEAKSAGKFSKKKLIIILIAALVLIGGGAGAFFFLKGKDSGEHSENKEKEVILDEHGNPIEIDPTKPVYLDLDEFLVNLNTGGKQTSFLKMTVTLELASYKDKPTVEGNIPRIRDTFQIYLRELRSSDLQGSAGMHRLREELLLRINKSIQPAVVSDILFKEIIVQ